MPTPWSKTSTSDAFVALSRLELQLAPLRHRFARVAHEVHEHLLQELAVAVDERELVADLGLDLDAARLRLRGDQANDLIEKLLERHGGELKVLGTSKAQEPLDDAVQPAHLLIQGVEGGLRIRSGSREPLAEQGDVDDHRVQRILDLVRDAGGELPECRELLRVREVRAEPRQLLHIPRAYHHARDAARVAQNLRRQDVGDGAIAVVDLDMDGTNGRFLALSFSHDLGDWMIGRKELGKRLPLQIFALAPQKTFGGRVER